MEKLTKRNSDGIVGTELKYYNYNNFQKMARKLAEYEDLEEQGGFISKTEVLTLIEEIKCNDDIPKNYGTLLDIMRMIRNMPTVDNTDNGWIPCSERLPEESGYYLVTYHNWSDGNFLPKYDDTYVRRLHYQISEHFVGWNYPKNVDDRAENDCHKEVIAWQPLPEPYKEV